MGGAALRAAISTARGGRRSATPKPSKLRTKEVAVCSTAQSSMTIQLRVHKHVEFGEAIHAVGALTELGGWEPELGAALSWCEGDLWAASVRLPVTEEPIKFKVRCS